MGLRNVGILDLGINNTSSLQRSITKVDPGVKVVNFSSVDDFHGLDLLFLPGVGNFGAATRALKARNLDETLYAYVKTGKPLIAICLGMQLLFSSSEESPDSQGLSFLEGAVKRLPNTSGQPVPNVGWSEVDFLPRQDFHLETTRDFYFTHSFYVKPLNENCVFCVSRHGKLEYASGVNNENILGFQFHPEKSGQAGLLLIKWSLNWAMKLA